MRFTSPALLIAPLLAFIGTTAAVPSPVTQVGGAVNGVKDKIGHLVNARDSDELLVARAPVSGIVNADGVRYRRCARTSCEAVGQYNKYQPIAIICRAQGESIFGWR
jgi:hypothetical protein